jgi:hypothetical protein
MCSLTHIHAHTYKHTIHSNINTIAPPHTHRNTNRNTHTHLVKVAHSSNARVNAYFSMNCPILLVLIYTSLFTDLHIGIKHSFDE